MCFSVNVNLVKEELEERYGIDFPDKYRYEPSYYYHAFSFPNIPALCSDDPGIACLLKWGLIPSWIRSDEDADQIRTKTFNARAESIDVKPSFSSSFISRRCIIPVKGFYEWQHVGKKKIPWYVYVSDNEIFSLAGLYSEWTSTTTGRTEKTFTIITTEANELMAEVHNSKKRMPAILMKDMEKKWIDLSITPDEALSLLRPFPDENLKAHTISPLINDRKIDRNTPDILKGYAWNITDTLF
jgi:putative SOS response-associated peptidase YedK